MRRLPPPLTSSVRRRFFGGWRAYVYLDDFAHARCRSGALVGARGSELASLALDMVSLQHIIVVIMIDSPQQMYIY